MHPITFLPLLPLLYPHLTLSSTLSRRTFTLVCDPHTSSPSPTLEKDCVALRETLASSTPSFTASLFTWTSPTSVVFSHNTCILDIRYDYRSPLFERSTASTLREMVYDVDTIMFQCVYASGVGGRIGMENGYLALRDRTAGEVGGSTETSSIGVDESGSRSENASSSSDRDPVSIPVGNATAAHQELGGDEGPSGHQAPPPYIPSELSPLTPGPDSSISSSVSGRTSELSSHPLVPEIDSHPVSIDDLEESFDTSNDPDTCSALSPVVNSALRAFHQRFCRVCVQCWENDRIWQRFITPVTTVVLANLLASRASLRVSEASPRPEPTRAPNAMFRNTQEAVRDAVEGYHYRQRICSAFDFLRPGP